MDLSPRPIGRPPSCLCGECPKCKHRIYMRAYYQSKTPEERHRLFVAGRDPARVAAHERARAKNPARRESLERSKLRYPEKERARRATHNAVARGKLTKGPCYQCGAEKVEAHHPDYTKPLEVIWACRRHHVELHVS